MSDEQEDEIGGFVYEGERNTFDEIVLTMIEGVELTDRYLEQIDQYLGASIRSIDSERVRVLAVRWITTGEGADAVLRGFFMDQARNLLNLGERTRALRQAMDEASERIKMARRVTSIVGTVRHFQEMSESFALAGEIPIDTQAVGDDPRRALDGYYSYFRSAENACEGARGTLRTLGISIPGVMTALQLAASVCRMIPNALENCWVEFERRLDLLDSVQDATNTPETTSNADANALSQEIRDLCTRDAVDSRLRALSRDGRVTGGLDEDSIRRAVHSCDDLVASIVGGTGTGGFRSGWLAPGHIGRTISLGQLRTAHSRFVRFMTSEDDHDLRAGMPHNVFGQLANHSVADTLTVLGMT